MNFNEYQKKASTTAMYPQFIADGDNVSQTKKNFLSMAGLIYTSFGLSNEAGEVLGKIKKIIRDNNCEINENKKNEIKKELGDVLWYLSNIAYELNISLDDIANDNLEKLFSRKERGVIQGSGDER